MKRGESGNNGHPSARIQAEIGAHPFRVRGFLAKYIGPRTLPAVGRWNLHNPLTNKNRKVFVVPRYGRNPNQIPLNLPTESDMLSAFVQNHDATAGSLGPG